MTPAELAATLDSTLLRLDATERELVQLCEEAVRHRFAAVMLYPTSVAQARRLTAGSGVKVGTVVGFPSGRFSTAAKAAEIDAARLAGADEVDIVLNYPALRDGRGAEARREIVQLCAQAKTLGLLSKVIVETCYLSEPQLLEALALCEDAGADFIKTSTGFGSAGAKAEHLRLWAAHRRTGIKFKASGGIKTLADARALLAAGAERLGASGALSLLNELGGGPAVAAAKGGY